MGSANATVMTQSERVARVDTEHMAVYLHHGQHHVSACTRVDTEHMAVYLHHDAR